MYWNWLKGGAALGLCFFLATALVKPIGVSTQFVVLDGVIAKLFNPDLVYEDAEAKSGYGSTNAYLNKSGGKYAKSVAKPLNYGFVFVLSMIAGGFIGRTFSVRKDIPVSQVPKFHQHRFGSNKISRYALSFFGGLIVLFGARLAGGCTSGHMMSGMMQTSISGYVFAVATFMVALPTAIFLYRK